MLAALVLVAAAGIGLTALALLGSTPVVGYQPQAAAPLGDAGRRYAPAREATYVVEGFLAASGRLPPPGTGLDARTSALRWAAAADAAAPPIAAVVIQRVRLRADASLAESLLDDDPTYAAEVDVAVTTADGRETALRFVLWDVGRLLPWGLSTSGPRGDGLKPRHVQWGAAPHPAP